MIVKTNTTISDVCSEEIIVISNAVLTIRGMCSQTVLANSNSKVIVTGVCNKLEISEGSFCEIEGTVHYLLNNGSTTISGTVKDLKDLSSNTIIKSGALVNGKKY